MLIRQIALVLGVFIAATLLALAFGAKNLGTALTFGQIAFAGTLFAVLMVGRRPGTRDQRD